jgi:hypothetical protein
MRRIPRDMLITLAAVLLACTIALCGGTIVRYICCAPYGSAREEEIRRLRQAGLAVNQEGEA